MGRKEFSKFASATILNPALRIRILQGGDITHHAQRCGLDVREIKIVQKAVHDVYNDDNPTTRSLPLSADEMISSVIRRSLGALDY